MNDTHPAALHNLPFFLPGSDGSDPLFTVVVIVLVPVLVTAGALYFKLHAIPEHLGVKHNSTQLQLISVLAVLALFTHNNAFWILALLIAVIRLPDFLTPLKTISDSLVKLTTDGLKIKQDEPSPESDSSLDEDTPTGKLVTETMAQSVQTENGTD